MVNGEARSRTSHNITRLIAIDTFDGQPATRAAIQLMPLLFPRPGELRAAERSEFDFDKVVWTIPAGRMKMGRPHQSPLSRQVIEVLRGLQVITGDYLVKLRVSKGNIAKRAETVEIIILKH